MAELLGLLLLGWLLASAVAQLPGRPGRWLHARDLVGAIPSWSFFAPNPARTDCHLVYRHVLDSGEVTGWTEAFVWEPARRRWLWNPDRRAEKAISDASSHLARRRELTGVRWSIPYLLLLNHVSGLPAPRPARAVQFALLGSYGESSGPDPFVRFVSDCHPLECRAASGVG